MIGFRPHTFINITPINPTGIMIVDLGELPEGASENGEVPRPSSVPPISLPRSHGLGEVRHGSLPPMSPTIISKKKTSHKSNFVVEECAQGTGSDGSAGDTNLQGEPEDSEVPLRNSQVSKVKEDHSV